MPLWSFIVICRLRLAIALVAMLVQALPALAQAVRVTGTSVALAPRPGFSPSSRFPGFEREDLQAAVMVTEIPGPVAELARGMTAPGLATRGMSLISSTKQLVDGRQALLLKVSQQAAGSTFLNWCAHAFRISRSTPTRSSRTQVASRC
jgi:hypothetical protein